VKVGLMLVIPLIVNLACAALPAAPPGDGGPSRADLLAAPERATIQGSPYTLESYIWRDFTPTTGNTDRPLRATVTLKPQPPSGVTLQRFWLIKGEDMWAAQLREAESRVAGGLAGSAEGGPQWDPGSEVTVVVEVRDSAGATHLVKLPRQTVQRTG